MQTIKIGYNTENFFNALNPGIENDIAELTQTSKLVERHPGGGYTAKVNPFRYRTGWGINQDSIDIILPPGKNDEERNIWIHKMQEQPDFSYMDHLAQRCQENPNLEIVWTANVFANSVLDNIEAIAYMLEAGVSIKWVECDNEPYFNQKYVSFADYANKFMPFARAVKIRWPYLKISVGTAPTNSARRFQRWNEEAVDYQGDFDCVTPHIYYGEKELPDAFESYPSPYVVDYSKRDDALHACFEKFTQAAFNNGAWLDEIATLKELFPTKTIVMTEFNTNPGDVFGNTLANEAWVFYNYLTKDPAIEVMCVQSGAGQILNCRWGFTRRQDVVSEHSTTRRLGYFTFKLLSEIDEVNNFRIMNASMLITSPGVYYAWFVNLASFEGSVIFSAPLGMKFIGDTTLNCVIGSQLYSSSGATGFQAKEQERNYEIADITRRSFAGVLPGYSYGYVKFELVKDAPPPPPPPPPPTPTKKKWWEKLFEWISGGSKDEPKKPKTPKPSKKKEVFLGLGASSPKIEFDELMRRYPAMADRNQNLILINGNKPGLAVEKIIQGQSEYFDGYVSPILKKAGVTAADVKYIWLKTDSLTMDLTMPAKQYANELAYKLGEVVRMCQMRYPNAKVYMSGRHNGYIAKHAAPRAQYNYDAVKQLADNGLVTLAHPFIFQPWGPDYVNADGVHPNSMGTDVAVTYMMEWYRNNTSWFTKY